MTVKNGHFAAVTPKTIRGRDTDNAASNDGYMHETEGALQSNMRGL
jgi:hypothetical protein